MPPASQDGWMSLTLTTWNQSNNRYIFSSGLLLIASSGPQKQSPSPCHSVPQGMWCRGCHQAPSSRPDAESCEGYRRKTLNIKVCSVLPNVGPIIFFYLFFYNIAFEFVMMSSFFPFQLFLEPCDEGAAGTGDHQQPPPQPNVGNSSGQGVIDSS